MNIQNYSTLLGKKTKICSPFPWMSFGTLHDLQQKLKNHLKFHTNRHLLQRRLTLLLQMLWTAFKKYWHHMFFYRCMRSTSLCHRPIEIETHEYQGSNTVITYTVMFSDTLKILPLLAVNGWTPNLSSATNLFRSSQKFNEFPMQSSM